MPRFKVDTSLGSFEVETEQDISPDQLRSFVVKQGMAWIKEKATKALKPAPPTPLETIVSKEGLQRTVQAPTQITAPLTEPPKQDISIGPTPRQAAKAITTPMKGFKGIGVLAAKTITKEPHKFQRAAEAIKPGFKPDTLAEKIGAPVGEIVGAAPLFTVAASLAGAGALGTGLTLAGISAVDQLSEKGKIDPVETGVAGAVGLVLPIGAKAAIRSGKFGLQSAKKGLDTISRTTLQPEVGLMRNIMELAAAEERKAATAVAGKAIEKVFPSIGKKVAERLSDPLDTTLLQATAEAAKGNPVAQKSIMKRVLQVINRQDTVTGASIKNLVNRRFGEIGVGLLESQFFLTNLRKGMSDVEQNAITFMAETGGKIPAELAAKLPGGKPTQQMIEKLPVIRKYLNEAREFMQNNHVPVNFLEDYIPHIWDFNKKNAAGTTAANFFTTKNPFAKHRTIPTLIDGIEAGFKPKTTNIIDILSAYDNYKVKTVANKKILTLTEKMVDEFGRKVIQRVDKGPKEWPTLDHPAFARALGFKIGPDKLGITKVPVKVHPDLAKPLNVILDKPFSGDWIKALEVVKGFQKKVQLSFSLFHHVALTESLFGAVGFKKAIQINANIMKSFVKGELPAFQNMELTRDAVRHGTVLGPLPEFFIAPIQKALDRAAQATSKIPGVTHTIKGLSKFNAMWDRALWDYLHTGYKVYAYQDILQQNILRSSGKLSTEKIKRITSQQVNDLFGGQNWDALMVHPKMRQLLNLTFLAPDWNWSAVRQFGQPFQKGFKGKQGRVFWARAAVYMYGMSNVVNYMNTKRVLGQGRWMWDNETGNKTKIFVKKDEKGRNVYMRQGKQFREVFEFLMHPLKTLTNKISPTIRTVAKQVLGTDLSGFPTEFKRETRPVERVKGRLKELGKDLTPFALSGSNIGFAFPKSVGTSTFKTREAFVVELRKKKVDKSVLRRIARQAKENNIDPRPELKRAQGIVRRERLKKR